MFELAEHVAETLDVGPGTRVFEVDCGSGDFLYAFFMNGYTVGGSDANPDAISMAMAAMPQGAFQTAPAAMLNPAIAWDVVICRSFGATHDTDHLRGLLARMFAKATHAIAILDVPDERREWMLHALAEIGANAIQFETSERGALSDHSGSKGFNAFARV